MMRPLLVACLFSLSLFSCDPDFALCKQKFVEAHLLQGNELHIPVSSEQTLIYAQTPPSGTIVKSSPMLGLYLAKTETPFPHPYILTELRSPKVAAVDTYMALPGNFRKRQSGLDHFGQFDQPLFAPCVLNDGCCALEGIVTHFGIIEKDYIRHFLEREPLVYGDTGARFKQEGKQILVESINPFAKGVPFEAGDRIIRFMGEPASSLIDLKKQVLFAEVNRPYEVLVERQGKRVELHGRIIPRFGGGLLSDTFLEQKGIYLDKWLKSIKSVGKLHAGDRIVRVNSRAVETWEDIRRYVGLGDGKAVLLIEREGFQFFVHLNFHES